MKGVLDFWLNCLLVLTTIFSLQRRLIELIAETKNTEFSLFERHGETEETLPELEQIENCLERLRNPYSRLHTLTLRISEYYPIAPSAILELLAETIEQAQISADVVTANLSETRKNWRLSKFGTASQSK